MTESSDPKLIDHLFRHQYGKMVAILTRIFGLHHLDTIEDAVQDTFISAMRAWQGKLPDNPEAWLTQAAKNRTLDLFRKLSADDARIQRMQSGVETLPLQELFLDHEVEDSVLRMIFAACNPALDPKDQIAFSLKTISGFSQKEIAAALLLKEETVKKRLVRARQFIRSRDIPFAIPTGKDLEVRLHRVLEVIYLIFNEGFHSTRRDELIREDLCGEAMRLAAMLQRHRFTATPEVQAVFALFCFQAARLPARTNAQAEAISLRDQDRSQWYRPMIALGHKTMEKAVDTVVFTAWHYEAAIAAEHTSAATYATTNWDKILMWYEQMESVQPSPFNRLNMAVVQLQREAWPEVKALLDEIDPRRLEQRAYLYHGTRAEWAFHTGDRQLALAELEQALALVENRSEREFLHQKKARFSSSGPQ